MFAEPGATFEFYMAKSGGRLAYIWTAETPTQRVRDGQTRCGCACGKDSRKIRYPVRQPFTGKITPKG